MILVTGGAGYIGSHTCVELLNAGQDIIVIDNLMNSSYEVISRIEEITKKNLVFFEGDVRDKVILKNIFQNYNVDSVIHFAGLKAVGESVESPLTYYENNVVGTLMLLSVMSEFNCRKIVFSSSATVYGNASNPPFFESSPKFATNPYGSTKVMVEDILYDVFQSDHSWSVACLRYFNPIGAHESGLIGEHPQGRPNNILPYILRVATGMYPVLEIYGDDYDTADGTGVRDYIHVVDLVAGHLKALELLTQQKDYFVFNLGTGRGHSVLQLLNSFESISGRKIPYKVVARRKGDIDVSFADTSLAESIMDWRPRFDLNKMCEDSWRWQKNNPDGYKK